MARMNKTVCHKSIGRYDDLCGLPEGHDGGCITEFTVQFLASRRGGYLCGNLPHGCDQDPLAHEWSGNVSKPKNR
jgi:hypothetical protein